MTILLHRSDNSLAPVMRNLKLRMMKSWNVINVRGSHTPKIPSALLGVALSLFSACSSRQNPNLESVHLAVAGQTVTKVRTSGNEVVLLEERLTSIFEDDPERTLAILQSDGHTLQPYIPSAE
jgi:hypothetical protein